MVEHDVDIDVQIRMLVATPQIGRCDTPFIGEIRNAGR